MNFLTGMSLTIIKNNRQSAKPTQSHNASETRSSSVALLPVNESLSTRRRTASYHDRKVRLLISRGDFKKKETYTFHEAAHKNITRHIDRCLIWKQHVLILGGLSIVGAIATLLTEHAYNVLLKTLKHLLAYRFIFNKLK